MFEFLRNLTKSAEEKRQATIAAYVDGLLNGRSRQQFEQEMAQDDGLRQEVAQLQLIKQSLRQLPQREVPRNFILDPAEFSRPPARQPWVQAYPVLRTATAMAAFFFMFALVAGAFTQFNAGSIPSNLAAPAADVAMLEETDATEAVESLAFEADTVEEAEEMEMAEEESLDDAADEEEAPMAEMAAEMMEEEAMADVAIEETAEESADEAAVAEAASPEEPAAADDELLPPQATAVANTTAAPQPTPTVSTSPRVTPPTPLPDRDMELAETAESDAANEVADAPESVDGEEVADTAVSPEESVELTVDEPANSLLWWQYGLGGLLLLLIGLTLYARRQRE